MRPASIRCCWPSAASATSPTPQQRKPQELLTCANAILGQGQLSLAKYLLIVAQEDDPDLDIHDIPAFFRHLLERVDWRTDLHFQTCTTIDTLDYSGTRLERGLEGGDRRRRAEAARVADRSCRRACSLPDGFGEPRVCLPGVLAVQAQSRSTSGGRRTLQQFCRGVHDQAMPSTHFPLVVLVDDSDFTARTLNNLLWVTFTRSNPAADVHGVGAFTRQKHWGCTGPLVIDARIKPHHAPPLEEDPAVERRVEALRRRGGRCTELSDFARGNTREFIAWAVEKPRFAIFDAVRRKSDSL